MHLYVPASRTQHINVKHFCTSLLNGGQNFNFTGEECIEVNNMLRNCFLLRHGH